MRRPVKFNGELDVDLVETEYAEIEIAGSVREGLYDKVFKELPESMQQSLGSYISGRQPVSDEQEIYLRMNRTQEFVTQAFSFMFQDIIDAIVQTFVDENFPSKN